jgi:hypothetical protein
MGKNHWRREYGNNDLNWYECKGELLKHYPETDIISNHLGYIVDNRWLVSPHKKWRSIGKTKWYFYKSIDDLVNRYFKKDKNEINKQV